MREILFRGKTTKNRWVEGAYFKHDTVKVCFSSDDPKPRHLIIQDGFCDWGFEPPIHCVEVDPSTIGQYTGLIDKNGKKIFEGDVVHVCLDPEICVGKVIWDSEIASYNIPFNNGKCVLPLDIFIAKNKVGDKVWIEVIGNIHDNPELLGGA